MNMLCATPAEINSSDKDCMAPEQQTIYYMDFFLFFISIY
jgi:hypothetical protein